MGKHREPFTQIYLHLVWATWDRMPLLTRDIRGKVFACLQAECMRLGGEAVAIGGVDDHVHVLVRIPATVSAARLAQQLKGSSSHLINHTGGEPYRLRWQGGYGVFSVSRRHVPAVRKYVLRQEERHKTADLNPSLEALPRG